MPFSDDVACRSAAGRLPGLAAGPLYSDAELSAKAKDAFSHADFWRLIAAELPFLRRAIRRWGSTPVSPEDLLQETLLQALANWHQWHPGSNLRGWLITIMRNQLLAGIARAGRMTAVHRELAASTAGERQDPGEMRLVLRDVERALQQLPSKQRAAILSICISGKSYREAAEMMGISVFAIRCHLARGRERLRRMVYAGSQGFPLVRPPMCGFRRKDERKSIRPC